jgi:CheY-like chemotaxis protein
MFVAATDTGRMAGKLQLARVLLVHDELASRLALQTLLQAGGYSVDVAASAAEAFAKLDDNQYELVLSNPDMETPEAGLRVLAYARVKDYRPATAVVASYHQPPIRTEKDEQQVSVNTEDVSALLGQVAELIGLRASRRARR